MNAAPTPRSAMPEPWLTARGDPFQAVASPVRRYILAMLADSETPAGEVAEMVQHHFGIGWPAVTKHLKKLHAAGFIRVRDAWPNRLYRLDDDAIGRLESAVGELRRRWCLRDGGGYHGRFEPDEAQWPQKRAERRATSADDLIDRIMLEEGFDPATGKRLPR